MTVTLRCHDREAGGYPLHLAKGHKEDLLVAKSDDLGGDLLGTIEDGHVRTERHLRARTLNEQSPHIRHLSTELERTGACEYLARPIKDAIHCGLPRR